MLRRELHTAGLEPTPLASGGRADGTAVWLLVGAGLMLRTALALNQLELGFETEGVLTAETRLTATGAAEGLVGAAGVSRLLATALFGVQPFDSVSFVAASAVLVLVAFAACDLPARRATRVDPIEAMRG